MQKEVSIVRVDTRNYRRIARDNWGLTTEQMKGMHVHHRIPRSQGGTNDPSNLYVCSAWFHKNIWHAEDGYNTLITYATEGGEKAYRERKGIHGRSLEKRHADAVKAGNAGGWKKSQGAEKGIFGDRSEWNEVYVESGQRAIARMIEKDPDHQRKAGRQGAQVSMARGVGVNTPEARRKGGLTSGKRCAENGHMDRIRTPESLRKGGIAAGNSKWMDPQHPELGVHNAGVLARKQRASGFPASKETRVRVG
jgi:hypothetical protein